MGKQKHQRPGRGELLAHLPACPCPTPALLPARPAPSGPFFPFHAQVALLEHNMTIGDALKVPTAGCSSCCWVVGGPVPFCIAAGPAFAPSRLRVRGAAQGPKGPLPNAFPNRPALAPSPSPAQAQVLAKHEILSAPMVAAPDLEENPGATPRPHSAG